MHSTIQLSVDDSRTKIDDAVVITSALCVRFEGVLLKPYICPAGVATIGVGCTHYLDGRRVTMNDPPISREAAMRLLEGVIRAKYLPGVLNACPILRQESPKRIAAITDFAFNLGIGALRASTLRRKINEELWEEVPAQLMRWNKAGGRVLRGLTIRRQAEANLI